MTILEEAAQLTSGPRQRDYDSPLPNHQRIADGWRWYVKAKYGIEIPLMPEDVAWMMILLKASRDMFTPKRDSIVDVAGYARCLEQMREVKDAVVSHEIPCT